MRRSLGAVVLLTSTRVLRGLALGCSLASSCSLIFGCSDDSGGAGSAGLNCSSRLQRCDVHDASCRQRIFNRIGCMRGHTKRETPPPVEFIKLDELLEALQEQEAEAPDPDAETQRAGLSLLGLVASTDVAAEEAIAERTEGLAALYIPESKQVIMIEDPGGEEPTEEELGLPVDIFNMSVLAHEYVHAYQDREYDLQEFQSQMPDNFDGQLAAISAIEGEAVLYEYEFLFHVMDRPDIIRRDVFEALVDAAEEALTSSDSPWLAARGIFPYTYGAHSAWSLESADGSNGLEELRKSTTTSSYIERRFGELTAEPSSSIPKPLNDTELEAVVQDDLGAWLLNGFAGRILEVPTTASIDAALQWSADHVSVWRGRNQEVLAQWVIQYAPSETQISFSWPEQVQTLANLEPPVSGSGWLVSHQGNTLVITASTNEDSEALSNLHAAQHLDGDMLSPPASDDDAGTALPSFSYQRARVEGHGLAKPSSNPAARAASESKTRRRLLKKVAPLLSTAR